MTQRSAYILLTMLVVLSACSTTKDLPPGQKLYTGAEIDFTDKYLSKKEKSLLTEDLTGLLRPEPNSKLGPFRFKLYIYQKTKDSKKGLKKLLKKFGEPPVLASSVDLVQNANILKNRLENRGYFQAQVTGDTVGKEKVAKAVYKVSAGPAYKYRNINFPAGTDSLSRAIKATEGETILKKGEQYNLDAIKAERLRIDARLKEKGFYYFAPENLIFSAYDTTIAGHQIDANMKVKDDVSDRARQIYTINKIYVYPAYTLRDTALKLDSAISYNWYKVIDRRRQTIRPYVFKNVVLLHPGEAYNRTDHTNSLNRFVELGPYKFVKNRFEDVSTADSSKLNAFYFLTQYPRKSLSLDALVRTTSANFNGTQLNLNWRHRNAFKGAELLTITAFASTDGQISGNAGGNNALFQIGLQGTLSWPRFISPFNFSADNAYIPRTNLSAGYSIIRRSGLYSLDSYNGSFGYQWKQSQHKQHELNLLNVTYVRPSSVTQQYLDSITSTRNPALKHVIDPQFTFGPSYSYTYTNTTETYRTNTFYYNGRASTSGFLTGLITGADTLNGKARSVFGTHFNQYIKLENEIRFFHRVGAKSTIAARAIASAGIPMGNSTILPYSQQFFIGGANSLRGFRARSIGPGSVDPTQYINNNNSFIADQSGDIKIEASLEYRPHLFSIVYGALFADAGNIWNARGHQPGGTFGPNFLSQMAVDAGFGLRFDASVLVLRTDFGFPLKKPFTQSNPLINYDKMVFNLAIGYPF